MPKRVAVIDLGSNSMRLAVFERTSRYGFFIVKTEKIRAYYLRITGSGTEIFWLRMKKKYL